VALGIDDSISIMQIIGMAFMLASFVFAVEKDGEKRKASWRWLTFCLIAFCCCGSVGVMQKIHQNSAYKGESSAFLLVAFITSFLVMSTLTIVTSKKEKTSVLARTEEGKLDYVTLLIPILIGVMTAVNHKLNLYLSGVIESAVFFPIVNGGGLMLTTLSAVLIFKERISGRQWIGLGLGVVAVLCLCLG
jgi:drug/metabolite transporter (DMT)-like permease